MNRDFNNAETFSIPQFSITSQAPSPPHTSSSSFRTTQGTYGMSSLSTPSRPITSVPMSEPVEEGYAPFESGVSSTITPHDAQQGRANPGWDRQLPKQISPTAVTVSGFPPESIQDMRQHFSDYGTIIKILHSGKANFMEIVYDNEESAHNSLQSDGILYGEYMINVRPTQPTPSQHSASTPPSQQPASTSTSTTATMIPAQQPTTILIAGDRPSLTGAVEDNGWWATIKSSLLGWSFFKPLPPPAASSTTNDDAAAAAAAAAGTTTTTTTSTSTSTGGDDDASATTTTSSSSSSTGTGGVGHPQEEEVAEGDGGDGGTLSREAGGGGGGGGGLGAAQGAGGGGRGDSGGTPPRRKRPPVHSTAATVCVVVA
ncbi:hypothetical protein Pelo_16443 [Pelomyxa schiedti]|nr:hypothetical protein Pelo_16443 [Pelomyxa schiedti]